MSDAITVHAIAKMIDHSLLHPTMTDAEIVAGCKLAREYDVATACIKPYSIAMSLEVLAGSDVKACAVIGFPAGNSTTAIKVAEAEAAVRDGAPEIDMVVNIGKAIGGDWAYVSAEIKAINDAVVGNGGILKVIFENDFLKEEQIVRLCEICSEHAVAFVKTSTGYGFVKQPNGFYSYTGATIEHLKLMRKHCPPTVQIKAAGGVRTLDEALAVRGLGVSRIGASATAAILDEARRRADAGALAAGRGSVNQLAANSY
ncbi:MAG TPA: deoxyribose-phosphate aldolase [Tepidisphaeraceae bacterium]|jgi:deoxyribose-phosphate aldolase|nr:deoxyribose-phosphate aldolase [Tepidisphaeraceae bacterium]